MFAYQYCHMYTVMSCRAWNVCVCAKHALCAAYEHTQAFPHFCLYLCTDMLHTMHLPSSLHNCSQGCNLIVQSFWLGFGSDNSAIPLDSLAQPYNL